MSARLDIHKSIVYGVERAARVARHDVRFRRTRGQRDPPHSRAAIDEEPRSDRRGDTKMFFHLCIDTHLFDDESCGWRVKLNSGRCSA